MSKEDHIKIYFTTLLHEVIDSMDEMCDSLEWSEEKEYARFHRIPQRLCPYNIYRKYVELTKVKPNSTKEKSPYIPLNA